MPDDDAAPARVVKSVKVPRVPPEYNGNEADEPQDFLYIFEKVAKANNWSEDEKMVQFATSLRGRALNRFNARTRQFKRLHGRDMTWVELNAEFIDSNGPLMGRKAMNEFKLLNHKQGPEETCKEYMNTMENLCSRVDIDMSEERRMFYATLGLRNEVLRCINPHNPQDMEALVACYKYDETTVLTKMRPVQERPEFVFMNSAGPSSGIKPPSNTLVAPEPTPATEPDLSIVLKRLERLERANAMNKRRLQDRRQIQVNQHNSNDQRVNYSTRFNNTNNNYNHRNQQHSFTPQNRDQAQAPPLLTRRACYRCGAWDHLVKDCVTPVPSDLNCQQGAGSPPQ